MTNWKTWIMTLWVNDWQSESDLDSVRNSCDVWNKSIKKWSDITSPLIYDMFQSISGLVHKKSKIHQKLGLPDPLLIFRTKFKFLFLPLPSVLFFHFLLFWVAISTRSSFATPRGAGRGFASACYDLLTPSWLSVMTWTDLLKSQLSFLESWSMVNILKVWSRF